MTFTLTSNMDQVMARFETLAQRELPFALAKSLTRTALDVRAAEVATMKQVFDRPTPYTLNAFQVRPATKSNLVAVVEEKQTFATRHYLQRQVAGGPRDMKGFESAISVRGHLAYDYAFRGLIPGAGAEIDTFGNWSRGQMTAVMAALRALRDTSSNQTANSRAMQRAQRNRNTYYKLLGQKVPKDPTKRQAWEDRIAKADAGGRKYFVPRAGSALKPAVYSRDVSGQLRVILAFTASEPRYQKRLPFYEVAEQTAQRVFPGYLSTAFLGAGASALPSTA